MYSTFLANFFSLRFLRYIFYFYRSRTFFPSSTLLSCVCHAIRSFSAQYVFLWFVYRCYALCRSIRNTTRKDKCMQFIKCVSMCTIFHMQALEKERNELKERNRDRKHFEHWTLSHWKRKTHKESAELNEWIGLYVFYINFCVERFEVSDNRRHTIWLHPQWFFHYSFFFCFSILLLLLCVFRAETLLHIVVVIASFLLVFFLSATRNKNIKKKNSFRTETVAEHWQQ